MHLLSRKVSQSGLWPYLRVSWAVIIVAFCLLLQASLLLATRGGLAKNESVLASLVLGILLPAMIIVTRVSPSPWKTLRLKGISLRSAFWITGASICFTLLAASCVELLSRIGGLPPGVETLLEKEEQLLREVFSFDGTRDQFSVALAVVVIAPIAEELLFRGLLQGSLEKRLGNWTGLSLTALAFGLLHGRLRFLPVTFLGILMGYAVMRTNSLISGVLAHSVNNALALTLAFSIKPELLSVDSLTWGASLGGTGLVAFLWLLRRSTINTTRISKTTPRPIFHPGIACQGPEVPAHHHNPESGVET